MTSISARTYRAKSLRVRAALLLTLSALLAPRVALAIGRFSPSAFKFIATVQDDGKGEAGGWQEATAILNFVDGRHIVPRIWSCRVKTGMPLRTVAAGRIAPATAAEITAGIATRASHDVMQRQTEWLTAEFCRAFRNQMLLLFSREHGDLGARVSLP